MAKEEILAAIQRAARELGRAPSRGELKRITGVSHYRVLSEFRTLREAIHAAGLKPNPKGKRVETKDLLRDWQRVTKKLGHNPSRSEYTREGRYSAGALTLRFGSWSNVGKTRRSGDPVIHGSPGQVGRSGDRKTGAATPKPKPLLGKRNHRLKVRRSPDQQITRSPDSSSPDSPDKAIAMQWANSLTQLPAELAGKRRVTEAFAMLIVNTLLGENSNWHLAPRQARFTTEDTEAHRETTHRNGNSPENDLLTLRPAACPERPDREVERAYSAGNGVSVRNEDAHTADTRMTQLPDIPASTPCTSVSSVVKGDRPIMGPPFNLSPLANAPINELGVIFLFGVLAGELGFQVDSMQGRFPDCEARRQVNPGKWQRQRIEFEYESKNFALHGHDPAHCDVIVCWRHNWRECPEELEVIELGRILGRR